MKVRAGLLLRVVFGAVFAIAAGAGAGAAMPGQDKSGVVDQPGYQPTPEEEQLTGAFEKQRCSSAPPRRREQSSSIPKSRFLYLVQPE